MRRRYHNPLLVGFIVMASITTIATSADAQRRPDPFEAARQQLVQDEIIGAGVTNQRVIDSVLATKR